jgi:hypothetical protein
MVIPGKALAFGIVASFVIGGLLALFLNAVDAGPAVVTVGFVGMCAVAALLAHRIVDWSDRSSATRAGRSNLHS